MTAESLLWVWRILATVGFGGVLFWMGKTIKAMKDTLDTQDKTISALRAVLEAVDLPKMAERFKAYKEITDQEKEADIRRITRESEEEKNKLTQGSQAFEGFASALTGGLMRSLIAFGSAAIAYVPKEERREFIDLKIEVPGGAGTTLKEALYRYAEEAPDLSNAARVERLLNVLRDFRKERY